MINGVECCTYAHNYIAAAVTVNVSQMHMSYRKQIDMAEAKGFHPT